jgi:hypothetical protein
MDFQRPETVTYTLNFRHQNDHLLTIYVLFLYVNETPYFIA